MKIRNWWDGVKDRPVTWSGYVKLCKWSFLVSLVISLGYWIWLVKDYVDRPKIRFWKKSYVSPETDDEDILI